MKLKILPYSSYKKAFTLVEVLVVIGIIAILSALVITAINPAQLRRAARDTNRKKDLGVIAGALEQYYADYNKYPQSGTACLTQELLSIADSSSCSDTYLSSDPKYLASMRLTESTNTEFCFTSISGASPQKFVLCAPTEADLTIDPAACTVTSPIAGGVQGQDYGVFCLQNPF